MTTGDDIVPDRPQVFLAPKPTTSRKFVQIFGRQKTVAVQRKRFRWQFPSLVPWSRAAFRHGANPFLEAAFSEKRY